MDGIKNKAGFSGFLSLLVFASLIHTASSSAAEPDSFPQFGGPTISTGGMEQQNPSMLSVTQRTSRESRCYTTARWMGVFGGSFMGTAGLIWNATGISGAEGSFGEQLLCSIPSIALGSYVGVRMTEWMTRRILKGNPKPGRAALKGAAYGFITGAVTLTASFIPLLVIGKAVGTIDFNNDPNYAQILGASALGGTAFGGTYGIMTGTVYGPFLSLYLRF